MSNIRRVYRGLEVLYGTEATDPLPWICTTEKVTGDTDEVLLVREVEDELELRLVLADDAVQAFERTADPLELSSDVPGRVLPILEGLSHLLYVHEAVRRERPISALELELQAEVDKVALLTLADWPRAPERYAALRQRLLRSYGMARSLPEHLHARYELASTLADRFLDTLNTLVERRDLSGFRSALQRFWGGSMTAKHALAA